MRAARLSVLLVPLLAGCLSGDGGSSGREAVDDVAPFLGYLPADPDDGMSLLQEDAWLPGDGVSIHLRIVRPAGEPGPVPVIVQFTPYTAAPGSPGRSVLLDALVEPAAGCGEAPAGLAPCEGTFERQFVRRGYAFAYGDVRGTGDSSGCLDLRGAGDIADAAKVIEWLGTRPWSNGKVGFIGASYPGSEAHMAALAEAAAQTGHLGAVIPVVASTSFYHYHHNDGVPYNGNHALGGTNAGYTQNALAPTWNVQDPGYALRVVSEGACPHATNMAVHGGLDQTGAYNDWWGERNLRHRANTIRVPVLMAQGLADWNVKPDHIATWFNELDTQKTLIAGQWGHQYPRSRSSDCDTYDAAAACDPAIPWGSWWQYAAAFFDTHLKGLQTGMFQGDVAWVQDNAGTWHRSSEWPLITDREWLTYHFQPGDGRAGSLALESYTGPDATMSWHGCPRDQNNRGTALAGPEAMTVQCSERTDQELVFETPPFAQDTVLSGVGLLRLWVDPGTDVTHLVAVVDRVESGEVVQARENYGYLNPIYREGIGSPKPLPDGAFQVTIDLYPQEDLVKAGQSLRVTLRSNDDGRTIEAYEEGTNVLSFQPDAPNTLWLPLRPAHLQGVRLG